jgi:hypothetical protein
MYAAMMVLANSCFHRVYSIGRVHLMEFNTTSDVDHAIKLLKEKLYLPKKEKTK